MVFEAFDVVLDICACSFVGQRKGDEGRAGPGVEELFVYVQFYHLLYGADAGDVVRLLAERDELVEDGKVVLFIEVLLDFRQVKVGLNKGLQVLLEERFDCLAGMMMEEAVPFLIAEDAIIVYLLHDDDVVIDVKAHVFIEEALALLEDHVELPQVINDVLEHCDFH